MAMGDSGSQIETLRERIEESEEIAVIDREAPLDFSDELHLLQTEYGDHRHLKLLRHCTRIAEHVGGLANALDDRDAAEEIVRRINPTYDNEGAIDDDAEFEKTLTAMSTARAATDRLGPEDPDEWGPGVESEEG
jgi:hypothetical protein